MLDLEIQPYIYNLIYDYDDFIEAQTSSDTQKNKFLKHISKVVVELCLLLPYLDFDKSEKIEEVISSYLKMSNLILYNESTEST
jgi:hypothetical protein